MILTGKKLQPQERIDHVHHKHFGNSRWGAETTKVAFIFGIYRCYICSANNHLTETNKAEPETQFYDMQLLCA